MKSNRFGPASASLSLALVAAALGTGCMTAPSLDLSPAFEPPPVRTPVAPRGRSALVGTWKGFSVSDTVRPQVRTVRHSHRLYEFRADGTFRTEVRSTNDMQIVSGIAKVRQTFESPAIVVTGTWEYDGGTLKTVSYNETLKKALEGKSKVVWYGDDEIEFLADEETLEKAVEAGRQAGRAALGTSGRSVPDVQTFSKRTRDERGVTTLTIVATIDGKPSGEPTTTLISPEICSRVRAPGTGPAAGKNRNPASGSGGRKEPKKAGKKPAKRPAATSVRDD